jgi:hypothetical protein
MIAQQKYPKPIYESLDALSLSPYKIIMKIYKNANKKS